MMAIVTLIIAILATYRIAHLFSEDDGPFYVFTRIRNYLREKAVLSYCKVNSYKDEAMEITFYEYEVTNDMLLSGENKDFGIWINFYTGINCPYCVGLYAAILTGSLVALNNYYGNLFLLVFAIAGGQSLLQNAREE